MRTCHWCHVMEREAFEDQEVAALLNKDFVAVKVDREERPDVDHIYMQVCQALTGSGGWPLTILMTPEQKPFFAATYLPKHSRSGLTGLMDLLPLAVSLWQKEADKLRHTGADIVAQVFAPVRSEAQDLHEQVFELAYSHFDSQFDEKNGGFGTRPKFPNPNNLFFLLRYYHVTKKPKALAMVEKTLEQMYKGGIYDHIGFGFCRYSVDQRWLVPHFEKMLYDNALLTMVYLETFQVTQKPFYARAAREIITYILRDMQGAEGGFYSAEDADSQGEEGRFYIWTVQEIKSLLGEEDGSYFCRLFDITAAGNFEGKSVPNLLKTGLIQEDERIKALHDILFQAREKRVHPYKDDKILCSWNGLMIAALAMAARILHEPFYMQKARQALDFVWRHLRNADGRLMARYREGEARYPAYLDDYAFLVWALLELYQVDFEKDYLEKAVHMNEEIQRLFGDESAAGLFYYGVDGETLLSRFKEKYDGVTPSGNAVATLNALRLGRILGDPQLEAQGRRQIEGMGADLNRSAPTYAFMLGAALFARYANQEVVIIGPKIDDDAKQMLALVQNNYAPFRTVIYLNQDDRKSGNTFFDQFTPVDGKTAAYVCHDYACQMPVTTLQELAKAVETIVP